jgi:hypothetical protein
MVKDKLVALLTNKIDNRLFYYNIDHCWMPLVQKVDMDLIYKIVGDDDMANIVRYNMGKSVVRCYRITNLANYHKHSNHNPNLLNLFEFDGYDLSKYSDSLSFDSYRFI